MPINGFIFAATGPEYTALTLQAAKTLRQHCPDTPIDLFTDQNVTSPLFAQVHQLEKIWHRPRMEALLRSRFDHSVYLDSDVLVLADISDVFEVLARFDIAVIHDQDRNGPRATTLHQRPIPAAFPQVNGGVMGITRNKKTDAFLQEWEAVVSQNNLARDQPSLRELLFDSDLRICTLPPEYNLYDIKQLRAWTSMDTAPRLLHHYHLHQHLKTGGTQFSTPKELLGARLAAHVNKLIAADRYLTPGNTSDPIPAFCDEFPGETLPSPYGQRPSRLKRTRGAAWLRALKRLISSARSP